MNPSTNNADKIKESDNSMFSHYIVRVIENDIEKYIFDRRVLVGDKALAKHFSDIKPAKQYFQQSNFYNLRYMIVLVRKPPSRAIGYNLGSIVE